MCPPFSWSLLTFIGSMLNRLTESLALLHSTVGKFPYSCFRTRMIFIPSFLGVNKFGTRLLGTLCSKKLPLKCMSPELGSCILALSSTHHPGWGLEGASLSTLVPKIFDFFCYMSLPCLICNQKSSLTPL